MKVLFKQRLKNISIFLSNSVPQNVHCFRGGVIYFFCFCQLKINSYDEIFLKYFTQNAFRNNFHLFAPYQFYFFRSKCGIFSTYANLLKKMNFAHHGHYLLRTLLKELELRQLLYIITLLVTTAKYVDSRAMVL